MERAEARAHALQSAATLVGGDLAAQGSDSVVNWTGVREQTCRIADKLVDWILEGGDGTTGS